MPETGHDNLFSHLFEFTIHPYTISIPHRYENVSKQEAHTKHKPQIVTNKTL